MRSRWALAGVLLLLLAPLLQLPWLIKGPLFAASLAWFVTGTKGFARWWTLSLIGVAMVIAAIAEFGAGRWFVWDSFTTGLISALVVGAVVPSAILLVTEYLRISRAAKAEARAAIEQIRASR